MVPVQNLSPWSLGQTFFCGFETALVAQDHSCRPCAQSKTTLSIITLSQCIISKPTCFDFKHTHSSWGYRYMSFRRQLYVLLI